MYILFKKLRRKLLGEKRSGVYFKYALGEIFLVMVGILLAIQVDNWNNQRKERRQEAEVLSNLYHEIESNLQLVIRVAESKTRVVSSAKEILEYTGPGAYWESSLKFDSLLSQVVVSGYKLFPEDGVMSDLFNSGKISLISNDSLRYLITSLAHDITLIQDEDDVYREELHQYFLPFIGKHYPSRNIVPEVDYRKLNYSIGKSHFVSDPEDLLRLPEFESLLTTQHIWFTISLRFYKDLEKKYRQILAKIDQELLR